MLFEVFFKSHFIQNKAKSQFTNIVNNRIIQQDVHIKLFILSTATEAEGSYKKKAGRLAQYQRLSELIVYKVEKSRMCFHHKTNEQIFFKKTMMHNSSIKFRFSK